MKTAKNAVITFLELSLITGIIYPLGISGLAQVLFNKQANGSLIYNDKGQAVGSELLAQKFTSARYFWPRPSAVDFATIPSGASNLGPTSAVLKAAIADRSAALRQAHQLPAEAAVPAELVHGSGSGLDPHITVEAARFQLERICRERSLDGLQKQALFQLVEQQVEPQTAGVLGARRINVLLLNLKLDELK